MTQLHGFQNKHTAKVVSRTYQSLPVGYDFFQLFWRASSSRFLSHRAITAALRPHRYSPLALDSREFRLLSVLPAEQGAPIKTELKRASLWCGGHNDQHRIPSWSCLSYSWRNFEEQKDLIWVDDQPFLVTSNLYAALQQLRLKNEPQILWVDQICIDQQNTAERGWQVRMMGDIFQSADSVTAWLGANDWATRTTIELLSQLTEEDLKSQWIHTANKTSLHLSKEARHGRWLLQRLCDLFEDSTNERGTTEKQDRVLVRLLLEFLQNPWFDRLWIVQEAAFASTLVLQSGKFRASWNAFKAVFDTFDHYSQKYFTARWEKFKSIRNVRDATAQIRGFATQLVPSALVRHHRHRLALDDRDKIFSLVGLCKVPSLGGNWIDYDRTVESVYASFTRRCIRHERTLNIFNGCCGALPKAKYTLPSWVTDWTRYSLDGTNVDRNHCGLEFSDPLEVWKSRFDHRVDGDTAVLEHSRSRNSIALRGYLLDTVEYVCDSAHVPNLVQEPSSTTWNIWEEQIRKNWSHRPQHSRMTLDETFWRIMSATYDDSELPGIRDQWQSWWNRRTKMKRDQINRSPFRHDCSSWLARLRQVIRPSTRLFVTKYGYMGLTCEHARSGDFLCFLHGGRNLLLLRCQDRKAGSEDEGTARKEEYILIGGETFVVNLSATVAFRNAKKVGIPTTTFCLV